MSESCLALQISRHSLLYGQLSASALDNLELRNGFEELESIAERVPLADEGVNLNLTGRNGELQADYFTEWYLHPQYGGKARLANVDRMRAHYLGVARIDTQIDFQL